eukprot:scaffold3129_cov35-Tisochrysis_lutea.AAC.3
MPMPWVLAHQLALAAPHHLLRGLLCCMCGLMCASLLHLSSHFQHWPRDAACASVEFVSVSAGGIGP